MVLAVAEKAVVEDAEVAMTQGKVSPGLLVDLGESRMVAHRAVDALRWQLVHCRGLTGCPPERRLLLHEHLFRRHKVPTSYELSKWV